MQRRMAEGLAWLFPGPCFVCRRPLPAIQTLGACAECWSDLDVLPGPWCRSCGVGMGPAGTIRGDPPLCGPCAVDPFPVAAACAAVVYDPRARRFVLQAKEAGHPELLCRLGDLLARVSGLAGVGAGCEYVVPVPSHPWLRLRRGFDPATELARGFCRRSGIPLRTGWLRRRWSRPRPLKRLGARERRAAVAQAFRAAAVAGSPRVLIVDDVLTTGATVRAAARTLLLAGAGSVHLAVWARTPRPGASFDPSPGRPYNLGFSAARNATGRRD